MEDADIDAILPMALKGACIYIFVAQRVGLSLAGSYEEAACTRTCVDSVYNHTPNHNTKTTGAFFNCGQNCCGAERFYVYESVHDQFVAAVVEVRCIKSICW